MAALLVACGQKGPLFLGEASAARVGAPARAASEPIALPPLPPPPVRP